MASKAKVPTISQLAALHGGYPTCQYCGKKLHAEIERVHLRGHSEVVRSAPVRVNDESVVPDYRLDSGISAIVVEPLETAALTSRSFPE
jgi:hypothetical protein